MSNFLLILGFTFKRSLNEIKSIIILVIIPIGLIVINSMFTDTFVLDGYNATASNNMPAFMLAFQFFNMGIVLQYLYNDFRGDMRWRLRSTPHSLLSFIIPTFVANWIFSVGLGIVIIIVSALFLNAYLGNLLILATVLILVSLIATLLAMIIFLLTKKASLANGLVYIISFGLMILSGYMFPLGRSAVAIFLNTYGTPLSLGVRAIMYSGALSEILPSLIGYGMSDAIFNIGILAAIVAILALIVLAISLLRRKDI